MKLRKQLELLKGYQIKVGSATNFFYCEICDNDIFNIIQKLSDNEYARIVGINNEAKHLIKNFKAIWKEKTETKIQYLRNSHNEAIKKEVNKRIKEVRDKLKEENKKLSKEERASLKEELTPIVEKEFAKLYDAKLEKLMEKIRLRKIASKEEALKTIEVYTEKIKNFIPYLEREVLDVYDSVVQENTKIINITGDENSNYWDREEYNLDLKSKGLPYTMKNVLKFNYLNFDGFEEDLFSKNKLLNICENFYKSFKIEDKEFLVMFYKIRNCDNYICYIVGYDGMIYLLTDNEFGLLYKNINELTEICKNHDFNEKFY